MTFHTVIRKTILNNKKECFTYIRKENTGEATLIDFDTKCLEKFNWKINKWYKCIIEIDKEDKVKNIRRTE